MSTTTKVLLFAVPAAVMGPLVAFPILITMLTLPGQTTQSFYNTCTAARGIRGAIVANPPDPAPPPDEVLLKIAQTATTLGFGNQGATVTVAIALRATGLANAANRTDTATQRYAHSALIDTGAGALGLPLSWGSPAQLMTPEVSTALALDHMVDADPQWRDRTPAQLAAQISGLTPDAFEDLVITAEARIPAATAAATTAPPMPMLTSAVPTTTQPSQRALPPLATTVLNPSEASSAAAAAPDATDCLSALTTALPPIATRPNPAGPAIAANAHRAIATDPAPQDDETPSPATSAPHSSPPQAFPADSAQFVAEMLTDTLGTPIPDTIAGQLRLGYRVDTDPDPGDAIYTDITAKQGPHLAGIALTDTIMVTVLPGHPGPETVPIGPNRLIRRIQQGAAS